ncbi:MAG: hypothetical protein ACXQTZ_01420 [Candidatus Alkanophagales archaeon]
MSGRWGVVLLCMCLLYALMPLATATDPNGWLSGLQPAAAGTAPNAKYVMVDDVKLDLDLDKRTYRPGDLMLLNITLENTANGPRTVGIFVVCVIPELGVARGVAFRDAVTLPANFARTFTLRFRLPDLGDVHYGRWCGFLWSATDGFGVGSVGVGWWYERD